MVEATRPVVSLSRKRRSQMALWGLGVDDRLDGLGIGPEQVEPLGDALVALSRSSR
jgi:hypothetical protein